MEIEDFFNFEKIAQLGDYQCCFLGQFCDVPKVAMIHRKIYPNFATSYT